MQMYGRRMYYGECIVWCNIQTKKRLNHKPYIICMRLVRKVRQAQQNYCSGFNRGNVFVIFSTVLSWLIVSRKKSPLTLCASFLGDLELTFRSEELKQ